MSLVTDEEALRYHSEGRKGKIEVVPSKPCITQRDLSLAYTPGVAAPCLEIQRDPHLSYIYTARGNLVAVITNGTAVLGLGNIGALAGKPVMEGKGVLFKKFADIDVFDIELNVKDPDELIKVVAALEPTFGGINLEDIKAPECFYIEEELKKIMKIPVFHDDQHGTAIIAGAGFLNALEITGKDIKKVKAVFSGAGAAAIATANMFVTLGVPVENIWLIDTKGIVKKDRPNLEKYRGRFAQNTKKKTLAEAIEGADVFVGLSVKGAFTKEMVKSMAKSPIIFAMANPDPEILPEEVRQVRDDAIIATGRSDYPNQVNNVLGFPFIFRGALDVEATAINEEMKVAAVKALATLAKEDVPQSVCKAYGIKKIGFGKDYIIPKPLDPRALLWVAPAVAEAAIKSGVARKPFETKQSYIECLEVKLGRSREVMRPIINQAKSMPKKIVFPEGDFPEILKACHMILQEGICEPILLGESGQIKEVAGNIGVNLDWSKITIIEPMKSPKYEAYVNAFYDLRKRKGVNRPEAELMMQWRHYYAAMMVRLGDADGMVGGIDRPYSGTIRPALQIIGVKPGFKRVAGMYLMIFKDRFFFFSDATINIDPTSEDLAEIAIMTADTVQKSFGEEPRVAMLSFSNFGSTQHPLTLKVRAAVEIAKARRPDITIDGEMMADTAVVPEILEKDYPFNTLKGAPNILIFPSLESANTSYKLCARLGGATAVGPMLLGMARPINAIPQGATENDVVNMAAITVIESQAETPGKKPIAKMKGLKK
jgi:malate dehydrogenase (oxaloacetate-decarboxylating)(NADP+)